MRRDISYIGFIILSFWLCVSGCRNAGLKVPPLHETYRNDDKNPFGGYAAYQEVIKFYGNVEPVFGDGESIEEDAGDEESDSIQTTRSLYMIIADELVLSDKDVDWIVRYVEGGNDLFMSANLLSNNVLRKMEIKTNQVFARVEEQPGNMKDTRVNIYFGKDMPEVSYNFYYYPFSNYFQSYVKESASIQGTNGKGQPDFIILFIGKGRLYLHLAPRAFSNYFLLTRDNMDYLHHVLNFFRPDPSVVYWDEYYKRLQDERRNSRNGQNFSSLRVIMGHPFLKWAFALAVAGFLMFLFSNMKRRQRIIPKQVPPSNASVDFVETVARLYYVNKNNKNIAEKLITYFYEYVRTRYFLRNVGHGDIFVSRLAGKKGMKTEEIEELITCIRQTEMMDEVPDEQLLKLNQLLENFYNHK